MEITHAGKTLQTIFKDLIGQSITESFDMVRPALIPFCFQTILQRRNNIFELVTDVNHYGALTIIGHEINGIANVDEDKIMEGTRLRLRGQMMHLEDWRVLLYVANPVMQDLNSLVESRLYINDLSIHDCSRDLILANTQQSVEIKLALAQQQHKSQKLLESMRKLDNVIKRSDDLLCQMIPKEVADRIRHGENPMHTWQNFNDVSILFTDVVQFSEICSKIKPLQVVSMLNHMYFLFDQLCERNGVYKVETVGDSYLVVCGAPTQTENHYEKICDMGLDMIDASEAIEDPSKDNKEQGLQVRVGCHSGAVVAGVAGIKTPRYCLFGDAVNTASRMMSTAEAGRIQVSESTKLLLPFEYKCEYRGSVDVKGKGKMTTYWLVGRKGRVRLSKFHSKNIIWTPSTCAKLINE